MSSTNSTTRVALCQIDVSSDKPANINTAKQALIKAHDGGAKLSILGECWNSPYSTASFPIYAETVPNVGDSSLDASASPSIHMLIETAKETGMWIVGGSVPERVTSADTTLNNDGDDKLYNTCVVVDPNGNIVAKHRKIHLFDIDVPGRIYFKESDSLTGGNNITTFQTPFGLNIGIGICYDIRFPELAIAMRSKGCNFFNISWCI